MENLVFIQVTKIIGLIIAFIVIGTRAYLVGTNIQCMFKEPEPWNSRPNFNSTHSNVCIFNDYTLYLAYAIVLAISIFVFAFYIIGILIRRLVLLIPCILFENLLTVFLSLAAMVVSSYKNHSVDATHIWALSAANAALSAFTIIVFMILRRGKGVLVMPPTEDNE